MFPLENLFCIGQAAQPGSPNILSMIVPMVLMFVIMYVILIKPQQKKQKEHKEMMKKLKAGDKVMTNGGIYGVISGVKDHSIMLKVADNVKLEVNRANIAEHLTDEKTEKK